MSITDKSSEWDVDGSLCRGFPVLLSTTNRRLLFVSTTVEPENSAGMRHGDKDKEGNSARHGVNVIPGP